MDLKTKVLIAARDYGINSILFRNALGRKLNLNVTESMCLSLLGIKSISSPKELADYIGLTTGATTTLLDRLEKKNFIKRRPNPKDRRGILIEFDDEYSKKAAKLVAGIGKANLDLVNSYSDKDLEIITDFLTRFTQNIVENTKKIEK